VVAFSSYAGINSWSTVGYKGPFPPKGHGQHRYFFNLYALDTVLDLSGTAAPFSPHLPSGSVDKSTLEAAMKGHVLAKAELVGLYERN
jgi:phosphatidylethanolamine-binding protein (PEBP) family uncharacterized protein